MTKTQEKLYELFCEIDEICKKNDIEYYIAGGTLIGAMRHKGFIPWDDDLDIMMTRKNYQKFIDYCRDNLPEDRVFECQELNRGYHNMFGRYTDVSTSALHQSQMYHSDAAGYVIDILPLDAMPDKDETYQQYIKDLMLYSDLLNPYPIYSFRWNFNQNRYWRYRLKMLFVGKEKVLKDLESRLFCHDEDECDYLVMRWGGIPFIFDKSMYEGKRYEKLLEVDAQVPFRTSDYLVWHYGDNWYMLPPNQEQQTHEAIFSLEIPQGQLRQTVSKAVKPKFERVFLEIRKLLYFSAMKTLRDTKNTRRKLKAAAFSKDFSAKLSAQRKEIFALEKQNDFSQLYTIFSEYFSKQLDKLFIGRADFVGAGEYFTPILIEIDDELFEVAIKTLINNDKMSSALRILEIYEQSGKTLSDSLKGIIDTLQTYRTLVSKLDTKEPISDKSSIKDVIESFPKCPSFILFALELYKDDEQNYGKILEYANKTIPDSLELKEILLSSQNKPLTDKIYDYLEIYENTQNGLLRLKIAQIFESEEKSILSYFENCEGDEKEKALNACYKIASLLPSLRDYISFYMSKSVCEKQSVEQSRKFYLSAIDYHKKYMVNDSDAEFFKQLFIKTFGGIYNSEVIAECLFTLSVGQEQLTKQEIAQKLESLHSHDCAEIILAWVDLKLGKKKTAFEIYKKLWNTQLDEHASALLSVALFDALKEFYDILLVLMDPDDFASHYKKVVQKSVGEEKSEQARMLYTKLFFDTFSELFGTPKSLADLLVSLKIKLVDFYHPTQDQVWSARLFQIMYESMSFEEREDAKHEVLNSDNSLSFKLLCEIDDICKQENIEYCLYGKSATVISKEPLPTSKIKILMNVDEFDRFVKIMQDKTLENRSFDSLYSNPSYHYFSAKYSSADSTRLNPHDIKNKVDKGVCVEILPVRAEKIPKIRKLYRLQEQGWESSHYKTREVFSSTVFFVTYLYNFLVTRFVSKRKYSRYIYNMLVKNYKEVDKEITKKYSINEFGKFLSMFDQNPLEFLKAVEYCGRTFFVPQNLEMFMKKTKPSKAFDSYHNENAEGAIVCCESVSREEFFSLYREDIIKLNKMINSQTQLRRLCANLTRRRARNWAKANSAADKLFASFTLPERQEIVQQVIDNLIAEDCALTLLKRGVPKEK